MTAGRVDYSGRDGGAGSPAAVRLGRARLFDLFGQMPWGLVALIVGLAMFGTAMLYSSTITNPAEAGLPVRHAARFVLAFFVMIALAIMPLSVWMAAAFPAYAATLVLLVLVEFVGVKGGGAQRWLELGPIVVQPSEMMKLALTLALARYYQVALRESGGGFVVHIPALVLILLPAALILNQPDLGTTLMLVASGAAIIFFAGLYWRVIGAAAVLGAVAAPLAYFFLLEPYQRARVDTVLNPGADPLGAGYQSEQAKIAIGSGGWDGKGFTQGIQSQLDYIPEQHTDFIFTVVAEEFGFIGAGGLLLAWGVVLAWGLAIAVRCRSLFGRFAAIGAVATIAFYVAFNIGMVSGLLPVVGVPLPLISYGGSVMMTVMAAFGLILSTHIYRDTAINPRGLI